MMRDVSFTICVCLTRARTISVSFSSLPDRLFHFRWLEVTTGSARLWMTVTLHSLSKGRCRAASCRSGIHGGAVVYLTVNTTQVNTTVGRPRHLLFEYAQYNIYWCLLVLVQEKVWSWQPGWQSQVGPVNPLSMFNMCNNIERVGCLLVLLQ